MLHPTLGEVAESASACVIDTDNLRCDVYVVEAPDTATSRAELPVHVQSFPPADAVLSMLHRLCNLLDLGLDASFCMDQLEDDLQVRRV